MTFSRSGYDRSGRLTFYSTISDIYSFLLPQYHEIVSEKDEKYVSTNTMMTLGK